MPQVFVAKIRFPVGKGLKRKIVELGKRVTFIDVKSSDWAAYAPCPMRRALNPG
jgi:hypothetical protein